MNEKMETSLEMNFPWNLFVMVVATDFAKHVTATDYVAFETCIDSTLYRVNGTPKLQGQLYTEFKS